MVTDLGLLLSVAAIEVRNSINIWRVMKFELSFYGRSGNYIKTRSSIVLKRNKKTNIAFRPT